MDETEPILPEVESESHQPAAQPKPAFTIVVHSWATPLVGVIMLAIGLLLGYFGRPFIARTSSPTVVAARPTAASPQPQSADPQEVMAYVVSQTRHFVGAEDAPVTIIEFSDFQ